MPPRAVLRTRAIDVAALMAAQAAIGAWLLRAGFSHVSDDDYARVVIAELFAHAPRLDPSGTSWLPFPFWIHGAAMIALGRSLATARGVAFALGVIGVAPPYLAARAAGVGRLHAVVAALLAMGTPWCAWLSVATVPEALTGSLVAAAMIASGRRRAAPWCAVALLAASLSRYEAWPVCAAFALACALDAARAWGGDRRGAARAIASAAVAVAGPLAWMAWNAHAHGSALHFFARVATYRKAIGAASVPVADKWLDYPRALVDMAPLEGALGAIGLFALRDGATRARWGRPLACGAALFAFLVYGDLRDGAPTHHPQRALVALVWLLAFFGVDAARTLARILAWARPKREIAVVAAVTATAIAWLGTRGEAWRAFPGGGGDARDAQIERGRALREASPAAIDVTPCAYEHFALLAAFGAPERATIEPATRAAVAAECPRVVVR